MVRFIMKYYDKLSFLFASTNPQLTNSNLQFIIAWIPYDFRLQNELRYRICNLFRLTLFIRFYSKSRIFGNREKRNSKHNQTLLTCKLPENTFLNDRWGFGRNYTWFAFLSRILGNHHNLKLKRSFLNKKNWAIDSSLGLLYLTVGLFKSIP